MRVDCTSHGINVNEWCNSETCHLQFLQFTTILLLMYFKISNFDIHSSSSYKKLCDQSLIDRWMDSIQNKFIFVMLLHWDYIFPIIRVHNYSCSIGMSSLASLDETNKHTTKCTYKNKIKLLTKTIVT